jgi:oligopeptide transport system substrate-binding protein
VGRCRRRQHQRHRGIDAVGSPQPTFAQIRGEITDRTITSAFRAGWQGDYPSMLAFLEPIFVTGAGANDVDYSEQIVES